MQSYTVGTLRLFLTRLHTSRHFISLLKQHNKLVSNNHVFFISYLLQRWSTIVFSFSSLLTPPVGHYVDSIDTSPRPHFYFHRARGCRWRDCNMKSQWFHFHLFLNINMWGWSCWRGSCQLVWGCEGGRAEGRGVGGVTGNSLPNIKCNMCFFIQIK